MLQREIKKDVIPLVSINCITYNHESYIRDCLDGLLMQKTNFLFEILIHDDASTDTTAQIIKEYHRKYPDIIKPIFQTENQYSKGVMISPTFNWPRAKGIYIASCEGDDYWTDPLKLQKQVDFLEENPDYVLTYHDFVNVRDLGSDRKKSHLTEFDKTDSSAEDLILCRKFIKTLTMCYRNVISDLPNEMKFVKNGDTFLISYLGNYGKGKWMGEDIEPGIYREHAGGVWSLLNQKQKHINSIITRYWLFQYYNRIEKMEISKLWFNNLIEFLELAEKEAFDLEKSSVKVLKENERELTMIKNSTPYKLGRFLTSPFRLMKSVSK